VNHEASFYLTYIIYVRIRKKASPLIECEFAPADVRGGLSSVNDWRQGVGYGIADIPPKKSDKRTTTNDLYYPQIAQIFADLKKENNGKEVYPQITPIT
jgi:hypothetical protein